MIEDEGDTWTLLVVLNLGARKHRFSELRREVWGISQRMLTETLRRLERDGLVKRTVYPTAPPAVEYELTRLGGSLLDCVSRLVRWASENDSHIARARAEYDARQSF